MYNHNKAQQSKNCVHISWYILYVTVIYYTDTPYANNKNTAIDPGSKQNQVDFKEIAMRYLAHWGRVTHIYVSILAIIGSNNGCLVGDKPLSELMLEYW